MNVRVAGSQRQRALTHTTGHDRHDDEEECVLDP